LLRAITDQLQKSTEAPAQLKYMLFSAHDSTQFGLMSTLEAPLDAAPDYASDLNFSLFEKSDHSYTVRVSFNDKAISIPVCGGTVCSVSQLKSLISRH